MIRHALIAVALAACARGTAPLAPPVLAAPGKNVDELPRIVIAPEPVRTPPTPPRAPSPPPPAPKVVAAPDPTCDAGGDDDTFHTAYRGDLPWNATPKRVSSGGSNVEWLETTSSFIACPNDFDVMRIDVPAGAEWYASMIVTWDPKDGALVVEQVTPSGQTKPASQLEPGKAVVSSLFDEAARITAPVRMPYRIRFQVTRQR